MDLGLNGRNAWVTGASRGIGLATARRLLEEGCRVAISARTAGALGAARAALSEEYGQDRVLAFRGDAAVERDVRTTLQGILRRWGRLDILVANVGTGRVPGGAEPSADDWTFAMRQNLESAAQAVRHALPLLPSAGQGCIVVIGSIAACEDLGAPAAYAGAKAALHAWAKVLARHAANRGVRVNCVLPGNILFAGGTWARKLAENRKGTERYIRGEVPMARFGTPEEVADAVAFLASARASFITGAALLVDGGQTRRLS